VNWSMVGLLLGVVYSEWRWLGNSPSPLAGEGAQRADEGVVQ
jgi:hypothetical protein